MIILRRLLLLMTFAVLTAVCTEAAKLRLSLDKSTVRPSEPVELRMSFIDVGEQPRLRTPDFQNFDVISTSTQTAFRFDNGRQTSEFTYTFELMPTAIGKLAIGPFQVDIGGESLTSNQVHVDVSKDVAKQVDPYGIELKAWFDRTELFSGQQVNYIMEFWRSGQGNQISQPKFSIPEFTDFIVEQDQARQDEREEVKEGRLYIVTKVSIPMIAVKQGSFEFPSGVAGYSVAQRGRRRSDLFSIFDMSPFAMGKPQKAYSPSVKITVKALPEPRPDNFDGLVGQFVLEATLDKQAIDAGGSLTLELKLTGVGNLQDWQAPSVEVSDFKVYADGQAQLVRKRTVDGLLGGVKTYKYALVPQNAGQFVIESLKVNFFDPSKASYDVASSQQLKIQVNPGKQRNKVFVSSSSDESTNGVTDKQKIKRFSKDVMPILTDFYDGDAVPLKRQTWWLLIAMTCFIILVTDQLMVWWIARRGDPLESAYREAYQKFKDELKDTESAGSVISTFVLRKLKLKAREVTPQELQVLMQDSIIPSELQMKLVTSLQEEEQLRYAGGSQRVSQEKWLELARQLQSQI